MKTTNIISVLNELLDDKRALPTLHGKLTDELEKTRSEKPGTFPVRLELERFLSRFREGCRYAAKICGEGNLPSAIAFVEAIVGRLGATMTRGVCYAGPFDQVQITYELLGDLCRGVFDQNVFVEYRSFGSGVDAVVRLRDAAFLIAVEECYHAYQFKVLKLDPGTVEEIAAGTDPYEAGVAPVIVEAAKNCLIPVFRSVTHEPLDL